MQEFICWFSFVLLKQVTRLLKSHTISKAAFDEGPYLDLEYQHGFYSNESSNSEGAKQNKTKVWDMQ